MFLRHRLFLAARALASGVLAAALVMGSLSDSAAESDDRFDVVVIDPGHGGADYGARGPAGGLEKDIVFEVSRQLGLALTERGLRVVYTRERDEFVTLASRTEMANRVSGDLFLSIHANSAPDPEAHGSETYFLSLEATDEEAMRVARTENHVFSQPGAAPDSTDIVGSILGDLIVSDHMHGSSAIAAAIQRKLARLPGSSRGVKQAPFVVLSGVNMPAVLVEIGFLTHEAEERRLRSRRHQRGLAGAIAGAVESFRDARNGELPAEVTP